ncbi:MAG: translocation/assembly module TamB domain-containing protein [Steroidobacteraceae bacterium]
MARIRRPFLVIALLVLALAALPPAAVYYAAFTPGGLLLLVRFVPRHFGHLHLLLAGVSGTAVGGIHIDRVEIEDPHVHLRFEDVSGRIRLAPLWLHRLSVPELSIGKALVEVHRYHGPKLRRRQWHFLPRGLAIRAGDVRIASGTLIVPDGKRFHATSLESAGLVRRSAVRIDKAAMTAGALHLTGYGVLHAGSPFGLDAATRTTIQVPGRPLWVIDARGAGTLDDIALHVRFRSPFELVFEGRAADLTHDWHWRGKATLQDFGLGPWHGSDTALGRVSGELTASGSGAGFSAQGQLTPSGWHAGAFGLRFRGSYSNRVLTVRQVELTKTPSGMRLSGRGRIGIQRHGPRLDLAGTWTHFRWPLAGKSVAVRSASGRYRIDGIWPYAVEVTGALAVRRLPPLSLELAGTLGRQRLTVSRATLEGFGGETRLSAGTAVWSPRPSWSAVGKAVGVNPATLRPDLPGQLTFDFTASGAQLDPRTDFSLAVRDLTGQLRGLAASGSGTVSRQGSTWTLAGVKGDIGRTTLALDGAFDSGARARVNLRFNVAASDLSLLDPRWKGRLQARGTLHGPRSSPSIEAVASGAGIRYRGISLASFHARADFDPRGGGPARIELDAHELAYRRHELNVAFSLGGPPAAQRARLALTGVSYQLQSRAVGSLSGGVWTGRLEQLRFAGGGTHLTLESPGALTVSSRAVRLGQICVSGKPARICGAAQWMPGNWSAAAQAVGLPLALLTAGVSREVQYRGVVGATARIAASGHAPAQGRLGITLTGGEVVRHTPGGRRLTRKLGSGTLSLTASGSRLEAAVSLDDGAAGAIDGRIAAERAAAGWRSSPLTGSLTARTQIADWAPLYQGPIDKASGEASASLHLSGTLGAPRLTGALAVANGAVDLYRYNFQLRDTALEAHLLDHGIAFSGKTHAGAGSASVSGRLEWLHGIPSGHLDLRGENLRVVDLPEAVVDASPSLRFDLHGRQVSVAGTVDVPHAHIAPADLTNAVQVSSDQIIVGEPDSSTPAARLRVTSAVKIDLGNDVSIETRGLTGHLTGSVLVKSGAAAITRATGELRIVGGKYAAYGRTLDIARGRLIYTGSPIDDPGIDIRAQKRFQDPDVGAAVAGINVRGTLREPRITFFSEPPLPQAQILSLVLAGGTLFGGPQLGVAATANTSRSENAQLIGQGAAVLGSEVGLPIAIEPTYNNDTALVLGKYLSPRLYVSYGITLLQSLNIVKLRYTLGDHWALSTEFGQLGGADIVYSFEK